MKISIVGGGRWARTIGAVLSSLPGRSDTITMHSPGNFAGVETWIGRQGLAERLRATPELPAFAAGLERPEAVIVVNRASEHFAVASSAVRAGIPTLVEKPVCLLRSEIEQLQEIARAGCAPVAASHVFLFARYFAAFAASLAARGQLQGLRFIWTDGEADIMRGEAKSYDPAVTIFDDVLPHIVPMIGRLNFRDLTMVSLDVQRGGARLEVEAESSGRPVSLVLARNDEGRRRRIEVATESGPVTLDFSGEPGSIEFAGVRENGDPDWNSAPRPLASMLTAFLAAAGGAACDERLSLDGAMASAGLAGTLRNRYLERQAGWLKSRLGNAVDASLLYALMEFSRDADRDPVAVTAAWSAVKDSTQLNAFLANSPLQPGAGYDR